MVSALLALPETMTSMGVVLTTPAARVEIRAFYGGLELGLALFFALAAHHSWLRAGLAAQAAALGGVAAARLVNMAIDRAFGSSLALLLAAELSGSLLGLWALYRLRGVTLN